MSRKFPAIFAAAVSALVVACGGSGTSSMNSTTPTSTAPMTAIGTITGFGSIFVNGVHFDTASATIRKNGQTVAQSDLSVGEIARVKGSKNDNDGMGHADSIDVDDNVVGPIATIDTTNNVLTVLGQTVKIDGGTSFSANVTPATIAGLKVADFVEVSGLVAADGSITATRIERKTTAGQLEVLGTVAGVDTAAHTFKLNALVVNYSTAMLSGFPAGTPANGDLVEVHGTTFAAATTTLTATRVELQTDDQTGTLEREGLITRFASATDFDVAGKPVTTTSTTVYRNGTAANLALNAKIEVEGTLNSSNVLVAKIVEFHRNGSVELGSQVTAVNTTAGTITVLGVQISVASTTRFEDKSPAHIEKFSLANIAVGDTLDVRGFESPAGSGKLVAVWVEREPASTMVFLRGPFTAGTSPQFTVFGITVNAAAATVLGPDATTQTTLATFLSQAVGKNIAVVGTLSGTIVTASKIRIDTGLGENDW